MYPSGNKSVIITLPTLLQSHITFSLPLSFRLVLMFVSSRLFFFFSFFFLEVLSHYSNSYILNREFRVGEKKKHKTKLKNSPLAYMYLTVRKPEGYSLLLNAKCSITFLLRVFSFVLFGLVWFSFFNLRKN